jgi:hypothetical protein
MFNLPFADRQQTIESIEVPIGGNCLQSAIAKYASPARRVQCTALRQSFKWGRVAQHGCPNRGSPSAITCQDFNGCAVRLGRCFPKKMRAGDRGQRGARGGGGKVLLLAITAAFARSLGSIQTPAVLACPTGLAGARQAPLGPL